MYWTTELARERQNKRKQSKICSLICFYYLIMTLRIITVFEKTLHGITKRIFYHYLL